MGNIVNKILNEYDAKTIIADENGTVKIPFGIFTAFFISFY